MVIKIMRAVGAAVGGAAAEVITLATTGSFSPGWEAARAGAVVGGSAGSAVGVLRATIHTMWRNNV